MTKELLERLHSYTCAADAHLEAFRLATDAIEAMQARVAELEYLDTQRLSSLRQVEAERNAAQGVIETITKDQTWFELKAERDALQARCAELEGQVSLLSESNTGRLQRERDRLAAELAAALPYDPRPTFGAIGSRDVDVAEAQRAWDKAMAAQPAQVPAWQPIESGFPATGIPVLADIGEKYPIRACWIAKFTQEVGASDFEGDDDYDEATDTTYWPEGWYEWNRFDETHWLVDKPVKNWALLPAAPEVK